jgi:hypothetical protein
LKGLAVKSNPDNTTWNITYYDAEKIARLEASHTKLLEALEHAVSIYGRFGAVVNEPSNPGEWIEKAKNAIAVAKGLQ